jgi:hypothetical protein
MRFTVIAAAALLVGGCHYRPTPVPLAGSRTSIMALAGTWNGVYHGTESGRSGSISFTIQVSGDSAFGDVLMETPPGAPVIQPADDPRIHRMHARGPHLLAVRFVDIVGGEVQGELEPYVAPDCDCTVVTTFNGYVRADTVRGTFVTRGQLIAAQTGVWAVTRSR